MLSYQHAYHAGNAADVLKHSVLCWVLDYLLQKDKPFYFHDTHAGRGLYSLDGVEAQKTGEHLQGVAKLWQRTDVPDALRPYLTTLETFNQDSAGVTSVDRLHRYPGSPLLAHRMMRPIDRLCCTELHPQEFSALRQVTGTKRNMRVLREDGYAALKAALPPREKRGVILIDPSYEVLSDDIAVIASVREGLERFSQGTFLVWYPLVSPLRVRDMTYKATKLVNSNLLQLELHWAKPRDDHRGLYGTGMLVFNPPWQLDTAMSEALPWLVQQLAPTDGKWRVEWLRAPV